MSKIIKYIVLPIILGVLLLFGDKIIKPIDFIPTKTSISQTEVNRVSMLLHKTGNPEDLGWISTPVRLFNEQVLDPIQKLRLKKWDGFDVITNDFVLSASISDNLLIGRVRFNFYDFNTKTSKVFERNILPFFKPKQSPTAYRMFNGSADDIIFSQGDFEFSFRNKDNKVTAPYHYRNVTVKSGSDDVDVQLQWKITPQAEGQGQINPLDSDPRFFIYNFKLPNIWTTGTVRVGDKTYTLTHENSASRAEYSRGVFPYHTAYWNARAQGILENGRFFSVNLGAGLTGENADGTEDGFTVDRYSYKLNAVQAKYNATNYNNTWTFDCVGQAFNFGDCHIEFTPAHIQTHSFSLFATKAELKTVFGTFKGYTSNRHGKKFRFEDFKGYIDVYKAKW